ncbi:hypothetical protein PPOLYM_02527 [Paenibacillus polymyxa]|nr:hypothetical protein PPOLYM_02527 [Paenibacillus polymyxa]
MPNYNSLQYNHSRQKLRSATLSPPMQPGPQTPPSSSFIGKWGLFTFGGNPDRYIAFVEHFDPYTGLITLRIGNRQTRISANELSSVLGPYDSRPFVDGAPHLAYVPNDTCVWIGEICYFNYT